MIHRTITTTNQKLQLLDAELPISNDDDTLDLIDIMVLLGVYPWIESVAITDSHALLQQADGDAPPSPADDEITIHDKYVMLDIYPRDAAVIAALVAKPNVEEALVLLLSNKGGL